MAGVPGKAACDADFRADWMEFDPDRDPGPVPSPCIRVCEIGSATGWCVGCQRRLEEIGLWGGMGDDARREVWRRIRARRAGQEHGS